MFRANHIFTFLVSCLLICAKGNGQTPAGFHWVDFKREASIVSNIAGALKNEDYTVIREIGVTDAFALVMTVQRDPELTTFDGDLWRVYNLSLKTGNLETVLIGYSLQVRDWIGFQVRSAQDLGIVYMNCWECEPARLFTALHYDSQTGWRSRWNNEKDPSHPGITIEVTDVGKPYTNEDVDQIFAVLAPHDDIARVGTWYYSRDLSTGKVSFGASKFWVDPSTGKDRSAELTGVEAKTWKIALCRASHSPYGLHEGQLSQACKRLTTQKAGPCSR